MRIVQRFESFERALMHLGMDVGSSELSKLPADAPEKDLVSTSRHILYIIRHCYLGIWIWICAFHIYYLSLSN